MYYWLYDCVNVSYTVIIYCLYIYDIFHILLSSDTQGSMECIYIYIYIYMYLKFNFQVKIFLLPQAAQFVLFLRIQMET